MTQVNESTPLVLADGTLINPESGKKMRPAYLEIPSGLEAQQIVTRTRRKLADLPDIPARMNTISMVLSYYMFGLDDAEIGIAIGIPERQVVSIKMLEAFSKMQEQVTERMISTDKGEVQAVLEKAAVTGANTIAHLMVNAEDEKVQLNAAKDVLDRNGHRPADVLEIRHKMSNSLKIEHIVRSDDDIAPVIDINHEDF